ncbi:FtsK/SpoIIIE domain-containing protein [Nocardiopsis sp. CC223A]|uniref:FtsK/SpoIIIE domain-containing protein n=1 Tax=Nocardiopsis sp. CC223A TaxID=3044051 RepID=UPI00278BBE6F|nr:FtsK/SpoIIIE domain-containing protein [Nocardiopsis sp. CC223A]
MSISTPSSRKSKKKTKRDREELAHRWSHRQGPFLAAANAASLSLAAATVGSLPEVGLPWWGPAAVGAIGATASYTRAATAHLPLLSKLYKPGRWAAFTGWTSLALATGGPWSADMLAALGIGAVGSALLRPATTAWEIAAQDRKSAEAEQKERLSKAVEWERRIDRVCRITDTVVTDIRDWDYPDPRDPSQTWKTGYTVKGKLPPAAGLDVLERNTRRLADDADLPSGCGVEVAGLPESRRTFELFISTVDALAETLPYPQDYSRRSIYDGIPNGVYRDGSEVALDLKWATALLIGATGSGKSSQLAAIMASLLRCDDVIIWGIDPNGGGVFEPYLRPWVEGKVTRPAIDWVATGPKEMHRMLDFALAAIEARKIGYADLMRAANDTKVPVSSAVPHIEIVTDETASLPTEIKDKLTDLSDRSRAASIRALICSLRAVSDAVPKSLISQAKVRLGLRVNDETELNHLFGWKGKLPSASEMPAEGYGLVRHDAAENPRLFRGLYADPAKGSEVAEATAEWRPELDDVTVRVNPGLYMDRWDRARKIGWLPGLGEAPKRRPATPSAPAPEAAGSSEAEEPKAAGPLGDMIQGLGDAIRRTRKEMEQQNRPGSGGPGSVDETFRALTDGLSLGDGDQLPLLLHTALQLSEGTKGVAVVDLATEMKWSRPTVRARMSALEIDEEPKPVRWRSGDKPERGYTREALEVARDRVLTGDLRVPPGIDTDE